MWKLTFYLLFVGRSDFLFKFTIWKCCQMLIAGKMNCQLHTLNWWWEKARLRNEKTWIFKEIFLNLKKYFKKQKKIHFRLVVRTSLWGKVWKFNYLWEIQIKEIWFANSNEEPNGKHKDIDQYRLYISRW